MNRVERFLESNDIEILKNLKGKKIDYITHEPFDVSCTSLRVVQLAIGEDRYYLYCDTEVQNYFGVPEDITYFEFSAVRHPFVDMVEHVENHIGAVITSIAEIKDTIKYYEDGELDFEYSFTRGLIFSFGDYQLSFEKTSDFTEFIYVRKGYNLLSSFKPVEVYLNDFKEGCDVRVFRRSDIIC